MSEWRIDEEQLLQLNARLQRTDDVLIHNCLTRTAQESKLFPIMPYLMMCFFDAYYRFPDLLRTATARITPEEIGHRARESGCNLSKLTMWGTLNFYLNGRTSLIKAGLLRPEDNLEDLWFMVDYHHRVMRAYQRASAQVWTLDSWDIAQSHEERTLQVFEADAFEADDSLRSAATRFVAAATQYNFLVHCESRVGLQASGPYSLGDQLLMHTRDFLNMSECDFSWLDGVGTDVPYNNLTMVLITNRVGIEITDWGTPYTSPENYQERIVGVGLYSSDYLTDGYVPVGMDSQTDLADTLRALTDQIRRATRRLYGRFAEMSFDQMVEAGIYVYFQAAADAVHMAGEYSQIEWETIDDRTRRFWPIYNEEYSLDAYIANFGVVDGMQSSDSEYYLHPVSYGVWRRGGGAGPLPGPARGFTVPAHVLADHGYTQRVNADGLDSVAGYSSLPPKSGGYTFTCGRLDEDEMNERARAFTTPVLEEPWRGLDHASIKYRWRDPEVEGLYRHSQRRSRLVQGRGSSLRRTDLERIRDEAGEAPWSRIAAGAAEASR